MNLSKNSTNARLFRWFYCVDAMPQSLCPYFWKLLVMWIFLLPYVVFTLPIQIKRNFYSEKIKTNLEDSAGLYCAIWLFSCVIIAITEFWNSYPSGSYMSVSALIGAVVIFLACALGMVWLFISLYENWDSYSARMKKPSLIKEFIKAKYNKYCPKINWE